MWNICGRVTRLRILVFIGQIILMFCWQQSHCYSSGDATNSSHKMPTTGLIENVLRNSSDWLRLLTHNNLQDGFDAIAKPKPETAINSLKYNDLLVEVKAETFTASINELLKRKDAGAQLLARYRDMNPVAENKKECGNNLDYKSHRKLCVMEILLAQYDILSSLTMAQRRDLLKECLAKYKDGRLGKYEASHLAFTALLSGRVLQQEKYPPFMDKIQENPDIVTFLAKGPQVSSSSVLNEILSQARQFLSNKSQ